LPIKKRPNNGIDVLYYEKKASESGFGRVAGIDEAGRGPLAGPVVAAAVVLSGTDFTERIDDSKKLTARMRERAFLEILDRCEVGIGSASVEDIDRINIYNATLLAMERAVSELDEKPDHLLIDGRMDVRLPQSRTYLTHGEARSMSIACASIIAKVFRDRLMLEEDRRYPDYGFRRHKGYGTREHLKAIEKHGLCRIHRRTFGPFGDKSKRSAKERE